MEVQNGANTTTGVTNGTLLRKRNEYLCTKIILLLNNEVPTVSFFFFTSDGCSIIKYP